jgi:hypothetical protein
MNLRQTFLSSLGVALIFAAGASAGEVKTDYDRNFDFHQLHTYSWETVHTADQLWVDRIKSAVDSALAAKGWTRVDSGGDVSVVAIEMTRDQQQLNTFYDNFGGGWRWGRGFGGGFGTSTTDVDTYKVGTLVVDLFNTKDKSLLWRGSASDTLSSKSASNIKNLDNGVRKMFEHFPPEPKQ